MASSTLRPEAPPPTASPLTAAGLLRRWRERQSFRPAKAIDRFLFDDCFTNPERGRRARLVTLFGFLGFFFAMVYAGFYLMIGHPWGVGIVGLCGCAFLTAPYLMRRFRSVSFGGNFLAGIMTLGFTALCLVEGGLRGHALAWLASVPLCALLLVGKRTAGIWVIISFAAAASVVGAELADVRIPLLYDPAWKSLVDSAGYLGLIAFLFALGLIFETGREEAFGKMTTALEATAAANERLSIVNKEKSEFMGVAAHDLRNPLTIIITYAEMLREGMGNDPRKFATQIYTAGTRMRDLITNLLDANAIEEGRFACTIEPCELASLIAQSVEQNQLSATRKETEMIGVIEPNLWAHADRSLAVQVLDNLISNALKYAPPKTRIFIETGLEGDRTYISIKDQGPGISADDQAKLFRKFTRLSARPTGGESSTGLGLSIVKRLVEAMQGVIECRSELGAGSTFIVRLPACARAN